MLKNKIKWHEKYPNKYELLFDGKTYIRKGYTKICVFCFFIVLFLLSSGCVISHTIKW